MSEDTASKAQIDRKCKCVRGIGLYGAELGIVKDCPLHGEDSGYHPPEFTYDSENAD